MKWKNGILHDYTNKNTIFFLVTLKMFFITVCRVLLISKEAGYLYCKSGDMFLFVEIISTDKKEKF